MFEIPFWSRMQKIIQILSNLLSGDTMDITIEFLMKNYMYVHYKNILRSLLRGCFLTSNIQTSGLTPVLICVTSKLAYLEVWICWWARFIRAEQIQHFLSDGGRQYLVSIGVVANCDRNQAWCAMGLSRCEAPIRKNWQWCDAASPSVLWMQLDVWGRICDHGTKCGAS